MRIADSAERALPPTSSANRETSEPITWDQQYCARISRAVVDDDDSNWQCCALPISNDWRCWSHAVGSLVSLFAEDTDGRVRSSEAVPLPWDRSASFQSETLLNADSRHLSR